MKIEQGRGYLVKVLARYADNHLLATYDSENDEVHFSVDDVICEATEENLAKLRPPYEPEEGDFVAEPDWVAAGIYVGDGKVMYFDGVKDDIESYRVQPATEKQVANFYINVKGEIRWKS